MRKGKHPTTACLLAIILAVSVGSMSASPLDDQIDAYKKSETQSEAAVAKLLKTGIAEGRSIEALAAVQAWLDKNPVQSAATELFAGLAMQRIGDGSGAMPFFRKFLARENLNDRLMEVAVIAVYRLLVNDERAADEAYSFLRKEGNRLRQYGSARRLDHVFLYTALNRNDVAAAAARLAAVYRDAGLDASQFSPYVDQIFQLLSSFEPLDKETVKVLDDMAQAAPQPDVSVRWNWVKQVLIAAPNVAQHKNAANVPAAVLAEPAKAAMALARLIPYEGARLAAKGWAKLSDDKSYRFWHLRGDHPDLIAQPFMVALKGMTTEEVLSFFDLIIPELHKGKSGAFRAHEFLSAAAHRSLVTEVPMVYQSLASPDVALWSGVSLAEAKALAPQLVHNPHLDAAFIRAYAAAGDKSPDAMLPVLLKSEIWRFKSAEHVIDKYVGHFRSTLDRDANTLKKQYAKEYGDPGATYKRLRQQVDETSNSRDRVAALTVLRNELLGTTPSTQDLFGLWDALFESAPTDDGVDMVKVLSSDLHAVFLKNTLARRSAGSQKLPQSQWMSQLEREYLITRALKHVRFQGCEIPVGPNPDWTWLRRQQQTLRDVAPELVKHLDGLLRREMQAGEVSETLLSMWLYCVEPQNKEARSLMKVLANSPAYRKLDPEYRALAAHGDIFGRLARMPENDPDDPHYLSRELLNLSEEASAAQVETALKTSIARVSQAARPVPVYGLHKVAALPHLQGDTRALAFSLFNRNAPFLGYPRNQGYEQLGLRLLQEVEKTKRWGALVPYAAGLWRSADASDDRRDPNIADALVRFAGAAIEDGNPSAAFVVARIGLNSGVDAVSVAGEFTPDASQVRRSTLNRIADRAAVELGMVELPVDVSDPAYGIYKSSAEYIKGNLQSAWSLYLENADLIQPREIADDTVPLIQKLPVEYSFWLLNRNIEEGRTGDAETLVKGLTIWSRQEEGAFSIKQEGELMLAYADLAFLNGKLPTARAWYRRVADASEYRGTAIHLRAGLGSVNVDRASKDFGAALAGLDALMSIDMPSARTKIHYARAEIFMDQEAYKEAFAEVEDVLRAEPNHTDALILRGRIQYQMRKLVEASEIELGLTREHEVIVPGEILKINLRDPALNVSGLGADIEVVVQSESGDRETLLLHQLGDSKDKYRAELPTALGAPVPGDKVLQVLGVDRIRYGYSQAFRSRMTRLPPNPKTVIGIASDANLSLSAGAFPAREGERELDLDELGLSLAEQKLGQRRVRPGNPLYVRVIDADQSKTAGIDQLAVTLNSSSGDEIRRLVLNETGPFTGEFEGTVLTAPAQATAFASDAAPGFDPNMAISPRSYPGWQGAAEGKEKARVFGVDLNDNAAVDRMSITWPAPDQSMTHFVLQTSLNGRDWGTRARYPEHPAPWDGRPNVRSFLTGDNKHKAASIPVSTPNGYELPDDWSVKMNQTSVRAGTHYTAAYVPSIASMNAQLAQGSEGSTVLMQYRALFYQPDMATRTFKLEGYPEGARGHEAGAATIFLIDGVPTNKDATSPLTIERELEPGVHEIQIWRHEERDKLEQRKPVLLCDVPGKNDLQPCSDSMFDPATFPQGLRERIPQPATITKTADGLDVQFGDTAQARLIRLVIHDFEGRAPSIKAITLTDRSGRKLLPVKDDFMALRKNDQLEVLPGDRIVARYEDEVPATPGRTRHEQHVSVAFNTASVMASFLNVEMTRDGRRLKLEPIRRFKLGDAVAFVIDDVDMDSSPERDVVPFTAVTSAGEKTTLKAVETESHSGRFIGRFFPVLERPQRQSELQVPAGGTVTLAYRDMENLDPGIPADRHATIEHAKYMTPIMGVFTVNSELSTVGTEGEAATPVRSLAYRYVDESALTRTPLKAVIGGNVLFDVVASHKALARSSEISAYAQVRRTPPKAGQVFDISLPGTLKVTGRLGHKRVGSVPEGYILGGVAGPGSDKSALDEGRFMFSVDLILGDPPSRSFATRDAESLDASVVPRGLAVKTGDVVDIGFAFKDEDDRVQWKTASIEVGSHAFLDVMDEDYRKPMKGAFVGENIYVRVLARGLDTGPQRDTTSVSLTATSGAAGRLTLQETAAHSGLFRGVFKTRYASQEIPAQLPPVKLNGLPVRYGDDVVVSYAAPGEDAVQSSTVSIKMGSDGAVEPFSKRYTGDEMAVKTTFTQAECLFELAKKHRKMGPKHESLARREMAHARKLLTEAIATHRSDDLRAHAEYLLGNLAQEYADLANNDAARLPMYTDALARFTKIPIDYPETEFAPKAQFKTALVYEKMGELDTAVEEYIKLAYTYPDCEYIPEAMIRLGRYFQSKGQAYQEQADALRDKSDVESQAEVIRLDKLAYPEFIKAATVYAKLQFRFPDHELAGLAGLSAAQNYMRAHQYAKAINGFKTVMENEGYDGYSIRAQAMYWCGLSHERTTATLGYGRTARWKRREILTQALENYRRVTFDFPDSKWAKYARGRLADPAFAEVIAKRKKARGKQLRSLEKNAAELREQLK